jgi:membrane protease YdiL (CAAX protease family)/uncharacterized RDD family membrane protein YckC
MVDPTAIAAPATAPFAVPPPPALPTASLGRRAAAAAIDFLLIVAGVLAVAIVGGIVLVAAHGGAPAVNSLRLDPAGAIVRALIQLAVFAGPVAYLYATWRRGESVGMRTMRCQLRAAETQTLPTSSQAVLRLCGLWFSIVCAGIGLIWGLVRRDRRGWPDLFAGTVVVHAPALHMWPAPGHPSAWPPPAHFAPMTWVPAPAPSPPPHPLERTLWTWTEVLPVVVLVLPLSLGVEWLAITVTKWLLRSVDLATRRPFEAVAADIAAYGAVFLLVLLFVKVRRRASLASLGLRRASWRWLLAAIPFAFAAFLMASITGLLSQSLFPEAPPNQCVSIRGSYEGALWLAVIGVALVAPLVEEIVFRGMVFGWLRGRAPLVWAVVISAALFSLEHIGFLQLTLFLPIFSFGIVLAILYHHARSIWPTVLVHGTYNLVGVLVLFSAPGC